MRKERLTKMAEKRKRSLVRCSRLHRVQHLYSSPSDSSSAMSVKRRQCSGNKRKAKQKDNDTSAPFWQISSNAATHLGRWEGCMEGDRVYPPVLYVDFLYINVFPTLPCENSSNILSNFLGIGKDAVMTGYSITPPVCDPLWCSGEKKGN